MKLCHIKRDYTVHIMCAKCPPSAEMHAGIFPKQELILDQILHTY